MSKHLKLIAVTAVVAGLAFAAGLATAAQPRMEAALSALRTAKGELQAATANKGGHRVNAIKLIDEAIEEVRKGIAAGA